MSEQPHGLVWFRNDLRAQWHSPLVYALEHHDKVTALFCLTPKQWQKYGWANAKINLVIERLKLLQQDCLQLGVQLHVIDTADFKGIPEAITEFVAKHKITHLYANADYEWDERQRDKAVKQRLAKQDLSIGWFHDQILVKPQEVLNLQGSPYKVFTPYFKAWLGHLKAVNPSKLKRCKASTKANSIVKLDAYLVESPIQVEVDNDSIHKQLVEFVHSKVQDYKDKRDFPAEQGTSRLSAYLAIGALAPAACLYQLQVDAEDKLWQKDSGANTWLKELAWRDFYRYLMYHFPHIGRNRCFVEHYDHLPWKQHKGLFKAWCDGSTGFPIVDAAMRCLQQTGWMHNRLRMIVASFLCKDLQLPWRWGEDYFISQLIDGDFASNNGGWQWSASVGADAAPYFRIFNPTLQGKRFDPDGDFIRRWCPELKSLSAKQIHEPSKYQDVEKLGYVSPIVDHKAASADTKALFSEHLDWVKMTEHKKSDS